MVGRPFVDQVVHERTLLKRILKDLFHVDVKPGADYVEFDTERERILEYLEHTKRMISERTRRKILDYTLEGRRQLGRLPERWTHEFL